MVVEIELVNRMLIGSSLGVVDRMIVDRMIVDHNLVVIDQNVKCQQHLAYLAKHKLC